MDNLFYQLRIKLSRAQRFGATDWRYILTAWARLIMTGFMIRLWPGAMRLGVGAFQQAPRCSLNPTERAQAQRIAACVDTAANHQIIACSCLARTLVLRRMLRRSGFHAVMRVGVRKQNRTFAAHSWLEIGDLVLDTAGRAEAFAPLRAFYR